LSYLIELGLSIRQPLVMPMPKQLADFWAKHPERWKQRRHYRKRPQTNSSLRERWQWYRDEFLRLAERAPSAKEHGRFLKYASEMEAKLVQQGGDNDAMEQYAEHLRQTIQQADEARGQREGALRRGG
jgi:hypothetical protein